MCRLYGKFASYFRRVLCKTRLIFPRINGPIIFITGQGGTARKNNCVLSSIFQQGRVALGKWCIGPQKGHLRTPGMVFFCTVSRPHFPGRALIWPGCFGEHILGLFRLYPSGLSQSVGFVSLFRKASLVSISAAILVLGSWHVYFLLEFEFRGKSCVEWEHVGENGISCVLPCILLLYIEWIWTNYCKLSRNFVGAIRTTTINCRVRFIDLYLVFPRNFRMVFLPHTNTVIVQFRIENYRWI